MAFKVEKEGNSTAYSLSEKGHWLDVIFVDTPPGKAPKIQIHLDPNHRLFNRKAQELIGIRQLFESLEKGEGPLASILGNPSEFIFDAGPKSKIRSVLGQAGVPEDMRQAMMTELQEAWQKQL